jgi:hypothetical protein
MSVAVAPPEAEEADIDPVAEARASLKAAFAARGKAAKSLEAARAATKRAAVLLGELAAEVEKHAAAGKRVTAMRTSDLKATLKAGKAVSFEQLAEVPKIAAQRMESESRRDAAKQALEDLQADEVAAQTALAEAEAAVETAIKGVVLAVAAGMADEVEDLEAALADLKERIGLRTYALGEILGSALTSQLAHIMSGANWLTNGPEMRRSLAHSARWKAFGLALATDPAAELRFDPPEAAEAAGLRMLGANRRGYDY